MDKIVYYCGGIKPIIELLISIYSLRKLYTGEIEVYLGETSIPYCQNLISSNEVKTIIVPDSNKDKSKRQHWKTRWKAMNEVRGNRILHPDCDTVFKKHPEELFNLIDTRKDYITTFYSYNDGKEYRTWKKHLNMYKRINPDFNEKPLYIEFGLLGWINHYKYSKQVYETCSLVKDDQTSMSYVLMNTGRKGTLANSKYRLINRARNYWLMGKQKYCNTIVWHTTPGYHMWWEFGEQAIKENYLGLNDTEYLKILNKEVYKIIKNGKIPKAGKWLTP